MVAVLTLISGPAGGGKSRWAEELASRSGQQVVYLATGPLLPHDGDWQERLRRHRSRRPAHWRCREVEGALAEALGDLRNGEIALVDSLGTWVAAGLEHDRDRWSDECGALSASLSACAVPVVLVSEQTGWGVVPATAIGGLFRDRLGALEQQLVPLCDALWLVVAGRALDLRAHSVAVPAG